MNHSQVLRNLFCPCHLSLVSMEPSSAQYLLQVLEVLGDWLFNLEDAQVGTEVVLLIPHGHQHGAHLCNLIQRSCVTHVAGKGPCGKSTCGSDPTRVHGLSESQSVAL